MSHVGLIIYNTDENKNYYENVVQSFLSSKNDNTCRITFIHVDEMSDKLKAFFDSNIPNDIIVFPNSELLCIPQFMDTLMNSNLQYVCCEFPLVHCTILSFIAKLLQEEKTITQTSIKTAFDIKKRQIEQDGGAFSKKSGKWMTKMGGVNIVELAKSGIGGKASGKASTERKRNDPRWQEAKKIAEHLRNEGKTFVQIATHINEVTKIRTRKGNFWSATAVMRLLNG